MSRFDDVRRRKNRDKKTAPPHRASEAKRAVSGAKGRAEPRDKPRAFRTDAANLAGLTQLMNPQHLKNEISLDDAERSVMGQPAPPAPEAPPADELGAFTRDLDRIASDLGIDLLDDAGDTGAPPVGHDSKVALSPAPERRPGPAETKHSLEKPETLSIEPAGSPASSPGPDILKELVDPPRAKKAAAGRVRPPTGRAQPAAGRAQPAARSAPVAAVSSAAAPTSSDETSSESDGSESDSDSNSGDDAADAPAGAAPVPSTEAAPVSGSVADAEVDDIIRRFDAELGLAPDPKAERKRSGVHVLPATVPPAQAPAVSAQPSEAQLRVRSALAGLRNEARAAPGQSELRLFDNKVEKIERIGRLLQTLEEEGVDCSAVPTLTRDSSMDEIDATLQTLVLKNDSNRCTSLAEEVMIGAAEFLSDTFDGTRKIPGTNWAPDYTGYSAVVAAKASRMRLETSQIVSSVFSDFKIGPLTRVFVELVPSLVMYPRQQARIKGAPSVGGFDEQKAALAAIRSADARRRLTEI